SPGCRLLSDPPVGLSADLLTYRLPAGRASVKGRTLKRGRPGRKGQILSPLPCLPSQHSGRYRSLRFPVEFNEQRRPRRSEGGSPSLSGLRGNLSESENDSQDLVDLTHRCLSDHPVTAAEAVL